MNNAKRVDDWHEEGEVSGKFVKRGGKVIYTDIGGCTGNGKVRAIGYREDDILETRRTYYINWSDKLVKVA